MAAAMAGFSPGMVKGNAGKGVLGKGFEGLNDCWKSKGKGKGLDKVKPPSQEDDRTCQRMPKRGEILLPAPDLTPPGCAACGNFKPPLVCGACQITLYCDEICQRRHWPEHKTCCEPPDEVLRRIVEDPRKLERGFRRRRRAEKNEVQDLAAFFARGGKKAQARARSRSRSTSGDEGAAQPEEEEKSVDEKRPAWLRRTVEQNGKAREALKSDKASRGPRPRSGRAPRFPLPSQQPKELKQPSRQQQKGLAAKLDSFFDADTDASSDGASSTAGSESGASTIGSFGKDTDDEPEIVKDARRLDLERQGKEVGEFINNLPPIEPIKRLPQPIPEAPFTGIRRHVYEADDEEADLPSASLPWKGGGVVSLSNGVNMPRIVLGTGGNKGLTGKSGRAAIYAAIRLGYRCIDTSDMNRNLIDVAWAYLKAGVPREELFFIVKIPPWDYGYQRTLRSFRKQLTELRLKTIDLLLLQWPHVWDPSQRDWGMAQWRKCTNWTNVQRKGSWRALEELYQTGKVRAIGVSNFNVEQLERVVKMGEVKPHVLQSESHPHWTTKGVRNWCRDQGVAFQGYAPLGGQRTEHNAGHRAIEDDVVKAVADKYNVTAAQVLIYWNLSRNESTVVKAAAFRHLRENLDLSKLQIRGQDLARIDALGPDMRIYGPVYWGHCDTDKCHPWINEEMIQAEMMMDPRSHPMDFGPKKPKDPAAERANAWKPKLPPGSADPQSQWEMDQRPAGSADHRDSVGGDPGETRRSVTFRGDKAEQEPLVEAREFESGESKADS